MDALSDTAADPGSAENPAVRNLPPLDTWSDDQRRGAACAYCRVRLRADDLVDLGEQRDAADGTLIFPRAHPRCAGGVS